MNIDEEERKTLEDDYGKPSLIPDGEDLDVPEGDDTPESNDEIFRHRHAAAEADLEAVSYMPLRLRGST